MAQFLVDCYSLYDDFNNGRFGDCHDREICESPLFDAEGPEFPFWNGEDCALGGASHGGECNDAIKRNDCTISNSILLPASCDPNPCEGPDGLTPECDFFDCAPNCVP